MQDSVGSDMDLGFGFEPEANWKMLLHAAEVAEQLSGSDDGTSSVGLSVSDKISELGKKGRLAYSGCCPFCDPDQYVSDDSVVARAGSRKTSVKFGESCDEKSGVMSGCCVANSCDEKTKPFSLPVKKRKAAAGVSYPVPTVEDVGNVKPKDLVVKKKSKKTAGKTKTKHWLCKTKKSTSCSKQNKNSDDIGQIGIPEDFKARIQSMGGTDIVLVIQKELFKSDVRKGSNRLSMPTNQHSNEFLRDAEKEWLKGKGEDGHCNVIEAPLLDPMLREKPWKILLRKWMMGKRTSVRRIEQYVLSKPWIDVAMTNKLKAGDTVQVWAFRVEDQLCFALVKFMPAS